MMQRGGSKAAAFARSVLLLGLVVVGVPGALMAAASARFGGRAPMHGVPSPADWEAGRIRDALTDRLTDQTLADVVIRVALLVGWAAVVVLTVTVVAEAVHMIRHDGLPMPEIRGFGMSQSVARVIAAGLLVVVPMFATPTRAVARDGAQLVRQPRAAAASIVDDAVERSVIDRSADAAHPRPSGSPDAPGAAESAARSAGAPTRYVVRPGDSIYGIAERLVGPEPAAVTDYAERLIELNMGRSMPDGQRFRNAAFIDVGWVLELPPATERVGASRSDGVHVVERGESLWSIADEELGDPQRWPEVFEANRDRTFEDGRSLHDPDLIHPGWELEIPGERPSADEQAATTPASDVTPDDDRPVADPVAPSDRDAEAAVAPEEEQSGPTNVWSPRAANVDGGPSVVAGAPSAAGATAPQSAPTEQSARRPDEPPADPSDRAEQGTGGLITLARASMLSGGILTLLAVRRRSRMRSARPRSRVPAPAAGPAATERALRAIDAGDRFARIDVAVRAVAAPMIEREERVVAVLVDVDGSIELHASGPISLDPPWEGTSTQWSLAAPVPLELLATEAGRVGAPTPTLVQLGRTPDDRDVYVDLEALEALEIGGPADQADAIVAAIAATLAGSVLAEVTTLVGLGVPDEAFLDHRHHVPVRDAQRAFEAASEAIGSTAAQSRSTFELRARAMSGEAWEPAVVLAGSAAGTLTPPRSRTGLAVVSASPVHGPSSRLAPDGDLWELRPAGIRLVPIGLSRADIAAIAELVRVHEPEPLVHPIDADDHTWVPGGPAILDLGADDFDDLDDSDDLDDLDDLDDSSDQEPVSGSTPPPWTLVVTLFGAVQVADRTAAVVEFERSKTRELVAWLATHRERSTRTAARTALWELDVRDATFANVVSEARRALARLVEPPEGAEWVGRTMTESLPLHELVRTDADLLEHALEAARLQPPAQAIATLRPAVERIAGAPFEGTSYLWPDAEGITSNLVLLATSAASELAAHCLSVGDIEGVFGATGRGLRVLPGHEELIGLRMQAHARAGDHAGVRHEWESYERVVTADPWSDGEPSPKLVDLRRRLLHPSG